MRKEKGIAYCGLACCTCIHNATCAGCKNAGCVNADTCKIVRCCKEKKIEGCYACEVFPCNEPMLKNPRIYGFLRFIQEYDEKQLLRCLEIKEAEGYVYHYPGQIIGDYDTYQTYEELKTFLLNEHIKR